MSNLHSEESTAYYDNRHDSFMRIAIAQAQLAFDAGEIPVGACIVKDGTVIATGHNHRERDQSPLGHAELSAIQDACAKLQSWRLDGCVLYVTLEPCAMCTGAILGARIARVVYGAREPKFGALGSVCDLSAMPFPHTPYIQSGILAPECTALLQTFFQTLRLGR